AVHVDVDVAVEVRDVQQLLEVVGGDVALLLEAAQALLVGLAVGLVLGLALDRVLRLGGLGGAGGVRGGGGLRGLGGRGVRSLVRLPGGGLVGRRRIGDGLVHSGSSGNAGMDDPGATVLPGREVTSSASSCPCPGGSSSAAAPGSHRTPPAPCAAPRRPWRGPRGRAAASPRRRASCRPCSSRRAGRGSAARARDRAPRPSSAG